MRRLVLILGSHAPFCLVQGWFLLSRAVCPRAGRFLALCSPMGWFSVGGGGFDGDNTCMTGCALFYSYAQPIRITKTIFSKSTAAVCIRDSPNHPAAATNACSFLPQPPSQSPGSQLA